MKILVVFFLFCLDIYSISGAIIKPYEKAKTNLDFIIVDNSNETCDEYETNKKLHDCGKHGICEIKDIPTYDNYIIRIYRCNCFKVSF